MYTQTNYTSPFKLFQQIGRTIRKNVEPDKMLQGAVDAIGEHFGLDRCMALVYDERQHELVTKAEYQAEAIGAIGSKRYSLLQSSEWYRLLCEGRPVPLTQIQSEGAAVEGDLSQLIRDTNSHSVIAFPLMVQKTLLGCLTVHYCSDNKTFSEDVLEMGEAFAEELAGALKVASIEQGKASEGRVFAATGLPMLVLESGSFKINQANAAAATLLDGDLEELRGLPFLELLGESDAQRLKEGAAKLSPKNPVVNIHGLLTPSQGGQTVPLDVVLSTVATDGKTEIVVAMAPSTASGTIANPSAEGSDEQSARELAGSLSRQLTWERIARQIISKLHSSLDRDSVLQSAADLVGRALRASTCLIIRTDSPAASIVTHEYADPNLSPLGLGRSNQLPAGAISYFKQRTITIADMSSSTRPPGLSKEDVNALLDHGVGAVLSAPIQHHGMTYGIIVVEANDARDWTPQEVEMLETIAQQAAVALLNAQSYAQMKDQLFNMNLISNLTQQLTTALDQAGRNARDQRPVDVVPTETPTTPLSSRELEVLKLIASGLANREIAQKLFLTESTVELHASRIRKKLKLKSRTALVKFACDNHLV